MRFIRNFLNKIVQNVPIKKNFVGNYNVFYIKKNFYVIFIQKIQIHFSSQKRWVVWFSFHFFCFNFFSEFLKFKFFKRGETRNPTDLAQPKTFFFQKFKNKITCWVHFSRYIYFLIYILYFIFFAIIKDKRINIADITKKYYILFSRKRLMECGADEDTVGNSMVSLNFHLHFLWDNWV